MYDSAREAAPSETEKPDYENDEDEDADVVKDVRASHIRTLHEDHSKSGQKKDPVGSGIR